MTGQLSPDRMYPATAGGMSHVSTRILALRSGVRVRVAESGPDGAPVVLLLHGWAASLYGWRHALELLPAAGFRVVAPDLRGFGLSDKPAQRGAFTLGAYSEDVLALLDALELDRIALGGHSMGGRIALEVAMRCQSRVESLVLINPVGLSSLTLLRTGSAILPGWLASQLERAPVPRWLVSTILRHVAYGDSAIVTERDVDEYWASTRLPGYVRSAYLSLTDFSWGPIPAADIGRVDVRTLVLIGNRDRLIRGARDGAARLPRGEVHEMNGGHCVHEEHPGELFRTVGRFLAAPRS